MTGWVRKNPLAASLRRAAVVTTVLAAAAVVVPGRPGEVLAGAALAVVVAAPLARVAWLARTWRAEGDRRFAALAVLLLALVATGAVVGVLT